MDTSLLTALTFIYRGSLARKSPGSDPPRPLASKNNIRTYLPHTNTLCISRSVSPGCTHRDVTHKTQTRKTEFALPSSFLSLSLSLSVWLTKKKKKTKNTNNRAESIFFVISFLYLRVFSLCLTGRVGSQCIAFYPPRRSSSSPSLVFLLNCFSRSIHFHISTTLIWPLF